MYFLNNFQALQTPYRDTCMEPGMTRSYRAISQNIVT